MSTVWKPVAQITEMCTILVGKTLNRQTKGLWFKHRICHFLSFCQNCFCALRPLCVDLEPGPTQLFSCTWTPWTGGDPKS